MRIIICLSAVSELKNSEEDDRSKCILFCKSQFGKLIKSIVYEIRKYPKKIVKKQINI